MSENGEAQRMNGRTFYRRSSQRIIFLLILSTALLLPKGYAEDDYDAGMKSFKDGDDARAAASFSKYLEQHPDDAGVLSLRGLAWRSLGESDKALADYNRAIQLEPKTGRFYSARGSIFENQKNYTKALEDYSRAIEFESGDEKLLSEAYRSRGWLFSEMKNYPKSIEDWTKAIELDPSNTDLHRMIAFSKALTGDYEGAITSISETIDLAQDKAAAYGFRAAAFGKLKKYQEALNDYSVAIKDKPEDTTLFMQRGFLYETMQDNDKALADYTEAIRIGSGNSDVLMPAYRFRAALKRKMMDIRGAEEDEKKELELRIKYVPAA
jgi:tetratricopeptide (TPR) repeat protein